nr:immunoglobulin light chain junction region [Macaca mulatta]MPN90780.1 immunoglobulin light chain junction region [Macaca mulatta]MPN90786.1 immunoglobulin light chain junction region [Macaca mulatta]MPN90788.1 immunoglobulin light chain junction region [Macaca mulatta]MPN90792.1 immunoglobulin light chain junction region [Macaca mulatta]
CQQHSNWPQLTF